MFQSRSAVAPLAPIEDQATERYELDRMFASPTADEASSRVQPNIRKCNATLDMDTNNIKYYGKRIQLLKMVAIVFIPVAVLTGLTSKLFVHTFIRYTRPTIRNTIQYGVELGNVVHSLQKERDMSALYISKTNHISKSLLLLRYPETDRSIEKLTFWTTLERFEFQSKYKFLFHLNRHRYELDTLGYTVTEELEVYTDLIQVFIKWLYDAMPEKESGFIWRSLASYLDIIIVKENIGLERALGMVFYSKGEFSSLNVYLWFLKSQGVSKATFLSAKRYSGLVDTLYRKHIQEHERTVQVLEKMRAEIRRNELDGLGSMEKAELWYNNMTVYMDLLLEMQLELAEEITALLDARQSINLDTLITSSVLFVCIFVVFPVIIYAVYKMNNEIHKYYTCLVSTENTMCKVKTRRRDALNQTIPTSLTESIINNVNMNTAFYGEVTILYASISGFDELTSHNSSYQLIELLNTIHVLIESQVSLRDVHRMSQTHPSMIVSGLPLNNGNQQTKEICLMALHLRNEIKKLRFPNLSINKINFRIGIHCGPVVAGLLGTDIPKYRIFGQTVALASKIETLGLGGLIHISQTIHELLDSSEGFNTEIRNDGICQTDAEMLDLLNGGTMNTYWLVDHADVPSHVNSDDSDADDADF